MLQFKNPIKIIKFNQNKSRQYIDSGLKIRNPNNAILIIANNFLDTYSGGRYYIYELCVALCQLGFEVVYYTDFKPLMINDFIDYDNLDKLTIVINDNNLDIDVFENNRFKYVIGCPIDGLEKAIVYSQKFNISLYGICMLVPPLANDYRLDLDFNAVGWETYKHNLSLCEKIVVFTELNRKHLSHWLNKSLNNICVIPPAINSIVSKSVQIHTKKDNAVVTISRAAHNKKVNYAYEVVKKKCPNYTLRIIGSKYGFMNDYILQDAKLHNIKIEIYNRISDLEKYQIINKSKILVHPSLWEDFGLAPIEAGQFSVPVLVFDNPILKEVYGNTIYYANWDDLADFGNKLDAILNSYRNVRATVKQLKKLVDTTYQFKNLVDCTRSLFCSNTDTTTNLSKSIILEEL